jgi:hypothetical protein
MEVENRNFMAEVDARRTARGLGKDDNLPMTAGLNPV